MNWTLARFEFTDASTVGALYDEQDKFICYTLEDACREKKIAGKTAIPKGYYRLDYTNSGRFNRVLPLLVDVPLFFGIRIHAGNTTDDTEGCILVAREKAFTTSGGPLTWYVRNSKDALNEVCSRIEKIKEPLFISIIGGYSSSEMGA